MIIVSKESLPFLLQGRTLTVELERPPAHPYRRDRTYAVSLSHHRAASCRVEVLKVVEHDAGLTLRIKHAPAGEDAPRMLARKSGYTMIGDPLDAGEALNAADQAHQTALGTLKHLQVQAVKQAEHELVALHERLRDLELAHKRGELDASRLLASVRRRVEAFEAKRRRAA